MRSCMVGNRGKGQNGGVEEFMKARSDEDVKREGHLHLFSLAYRHV